MTEVCAFFCQESFVDDVVVEEYSTNNFQLKNNVTQENKLRKVTKI